MKSLSNKNRKSAESSLETQHIWKPSSRRHPSYDFDADKDVIKEKTTNVLKLLFGDSTSTKDDSGHEETDDCIINDLKKLKINPSSDSKVKLGFFKNPTTVKEFVPKTLNKPTTLSLKPSQVSSFSKKSKSSIKKSSKLKSIPPPKLFPVKFSPSLPVFTAYNYYQPVILENGNIIYSVNRLYLNNNIKGPMGNGWFEMK